MKPTAKVGLVLGGYLIAGLIATAVVAVYIAMTSSPDRQVYGAMYDFGDSLLFLGVFGVAATVPTGAALIFLRSYPRFWQTISVFALAIAATGVAAVIIFLMARHAAVGPAATGSATSVWASVAVLRILIAPLFALTFCVAGGFAPERAFRIRLFTAGIVEGVVFVA
ncbi:MAG: hypothetical protein ABI765_01020 [Gemmatimonadota bacterium]